LVLRALEYALRKVLPSIPKLLPIASAEITAYMVTSRHRAEHGAGFNLDRSMAARSIDMGSCAEYPERSNRLPNAPETKRRVCLQAQGDLIKQVSKHTFQLSPCKSMFV